MLHDQRGARTEWPGEGEVCQVEQLPPQSVDSPDLGDEVRIDPFHGRQPVTPLEHLQFVAEPRLGRLGDVLLSKEVVLVGELKLFEIWDKDSWDKEFQRARDEFLEASQALSGLGI